MLIFVQIGSVPTPWPSWLIAAHPERAQAKDLSAFLDGLTKFVNDFDSPDARATKNIPFIESKFGYQKADIEASISAVYLPMVGSQISSSRLG